MIGSDLYKIKTLGMSGKPENIDELALKTILGKDINRLKPAVKSIIADALKKARERKERKSS